MKQMLHRAQSRGHAQHGWLDSHHTFSFAHYFNPERMHFGRLRVINDDRVIGGAGFGTHPHQNMEIVSIPLQGALEHKDSMGHGSVIHAGDVQIMSAGTGVTHSEFNPDPEQEVNFLQIWVLPAQQNIQARYGQKHFPASERQNQLQMVVSPKHENALWINQDAYFLLGQFSLGQQTSYRLQKSDHGVYLFVISGEVKVGQTPLKARDGLGLWEISELKIQAETDSEILLIEVPLD